MDERHDSFLAAAGAAAALVGLVFVGLFINLEMIKSNPTYGLTGRALEAIALLMAVLIATSLFSAASLVRSNGDVVCGDVWRLA